mmetsp:Transcript_53848/g.89377  ORF Transcript_53848/g.89377 Transcript_53848/m.89377 type:complete len:149 (+) Transcript_53848:36-482(+)
MKTKAGVITMLFGIILTSEDVFPVLETGQVKWHDSGHDDLRKLIIYWQQYPTATGYQICHNCDINAAGERTGTGGILWPVPVGREGTCGERPCKVFKTMGLGVQTFHIRAVMSAEKYDVRFTRWSTPFMYDVQAVGPTMTLQKNKDEL